MFKNIRSEYSVQSAPIDDPEELENLLNTMSKDGWDLYTLHEAESSTGKPCYNCIFVKEVEDDEEENDLVDIGDFKSKIEKMYEPSNEPYQQCRQIQRKIKEQQARIETVKNLLENTTKEKEHNKLNEEMTNGLKTLKDLKSELSDIIEPEKMYEKVNTPKLSIILSEDLTNLVNSEFEAPLLTQTVLLRQKLTEELGYVIPSIHFSNSETLEPNEFVIEVRGIEAVRGYAYQGYRMVYPSTVNIGRKPKDAIENVDFIKKEKVFWLKEEVTKNFWEKGLSADEAIAKALEHVVLKYVNEILDYSDVNKYVEIVSRKNVYLVESLIPEALSVGDIRFVFAQLIKDRIPLTDIVYIFERLNDYANDEEKENILEHLRISMARHISKSLADENGVIYGIKFSDKVIGEFELALFNETDNITINVKFIKKLLKQIKNILKENEEITNIVILVPSLLRHLLSVIFEQFIPDVKFVANEEISPDFTLEVVGSVELQ